MTYLLDVSTLIALLWKTHAHHERVSAWQAGLSLAVCPLTELGFLRISTQPTFGLSVRNARNALKGWKETRKPAFIPCDLEALDTDPPTKGSLTTDFYLAALAARYGMKLATLDEAIPHRSVLVIPA